MNPFTMYKLYSMQRSGNSYKVRLALALLNAPYCAIEVDILRGESRTPGSASGLGKRARGNRRTAPQADLTPVTPYPRTGCPAVSIQSGWVGTVPPPSRISPQPNWVVCCASRMGRRAG